jgi:hypothetical protein
MDFINVVLWKLRKMLLKTSSQQVITKTTASSYPSAIYREDHAGRTKWYSFMRQDEMKTYYKIDELTNTLKLTIKEKYPACNEVNVDYYMYNGFYHTEESYLDLNSRMKIDVSVRWSNGTTYDLVNATVESICKQHFKSIPVFKNEHWHDAGVETLWSCFHCRRTYSDDVILNAARKYADHISSGLPINSDTVKSLKLGDVTLYDLAIMDLNRINL